MGTHFDVMNKEFPLEYTKRKGIVFDVSGIKNRDIDCADHGDMTKAVPFENETFDIIFNPVSNVYVEDLENIYKEASRVLKKGGLLMVGLQDSSLFYFP